MEQIKGEGQFREKLEMQESVKIAFGRGVNLGKKEHRGEKKKI